LERGERRSLGRTMFLAIILAVFVFSVVSVTITAATISVPRTDGLNQTLSSRIAQQLGDPIDGGPPGRSSFS
jgi:hypothetical protein